MDTMGEFNMRYLYYKSTVSLQNEKNNRTVELEYQILQERRKELKMTQQEVADKSGIQLRQYQRFESAERSISSSSGKILLAICETLKLDPYVLLNKGNDMLEHKYLILPPIVKNGIYYEIPPEAYYGIVSAIPYGMVSTDDEIMNCLRNVYGIDSLEIGEDYNSSALHINDSFPFWRVVSTRGYLINNFYMSKEKQFKKLTDEGVKINKVGENESYRVDDFDFYHYGVDNLSITVLKTKKQIAEEYNIISKERDEG